MDIESKYVKHFYDVVADSWFHIRQKFSILKKFKDLKGKKVLEVGCGTATQLLEFEGNLLFGLDFSKGMIKFAKENAKRKNVKAFFVIGDARRLPFKSNSFDFVFSFATIHHIKKREERIKAILEMIRVSNDFCLFSVLKRYSSLTFFRLFSNFFRFFVWGEIFLEWNYKGKKLKRFYHTYSFLELKRDLEIVKKVRNIEYQILEDKYNYYVI